MECGVGHEAVPLLDQAESVYDGFDRSDIMEELGKIYRGGIGQAWSSVNAKSCLHYALLAAGLEEERHAKIGHATSVLATAYNDLAMAHGLNSLFEEAIPRLHKSKEIREGLPGFTRDKFIFSFLSPWTHVSLPGPT